jgi:hypothetical protein
VTSVSAFLGCLWFGFLRLWLSPKKQKPTKWQKLGTSFSKSTCFSQFIFESRVGRCFPRLFTVATSKKLPTVTRYVLTDSFLSVVFPAPARYQEPCGHHSAPPPEKSMTSASPPPNSHPSQLPHLLLDIPSPPFLQLRQSTARDSRSRGRRSSPPFLPRERR